MLLRSRVVRSLLATLLVFSVVFVANPVFVSAYQLNSYDFLSRDLVRPDQISYDDARHKGHIKRVPSMEDEYTFVFENLDGTITSYSYNTKVQSKDNHGRLHEIDWDINAKNDLNGKVTSYAIQGDGYQISLPITLDEEQPVIVTNDDYSISIAPVAISEKQVKCAPGQLKKLKDYYGTIAYNNAFGENTSLEISTTATGYKEDIILKKAPESNIFSYQITAPGLVGRILEDGSTIFYDPETLAVIYTMPAPYAIDSFKGNRIEGDNHYTDDIDVTINQQDDGSWLYSLAVDECFLYSANTRYPVIIDPSLTISNSSNTYDTYVASGTQTTLYYTTPHMFVGKDSTLLVCRAYTQFNLTTLFSSTTDALIVTDAQYVNQEYLGYTSTCYIQLYRVTSSWQSSTLDWSPQPEKSSTITDSKLVNQAGTYSWDVTPIVEGWLKGYHGLEDGFANNGFTLWSDREGSIVLRKFRSSEYSTTLPRLEITYTAVDRVAPNKPTGLTTTYIKNSSFDGTAKLKVSWTAATDLPSVGGSGIKNYEVIVKNASGTTLETNTNVTTTSFTTTNYYADNATYTFYVRSVDNAKEVDGTGIYNESTDATATLAVPDCEKPSISSLTVTPSSWTNASSVTLGWTVVEPSGLGKLEYWIDSGSTTTITSPALTGTTNVSTSGLSNASHTLNVRFTDAQSNIVTSTKTIYIDKAAPSVSTLWSPGHTSTSVDLSWTAASDTISGFANYKVYCDSTLVNTTTSTTYTVTGLENVTSHTFYIRAYDTAGNFSTSNTYGVVDITAPSAIMDLAASDISGTSTSLDWSAATDDIGVAGYKIYVNGTLIDNTTSTSYQVNGLLHNTDYTLSVKAYDDADNIADISNEVEITTLAWAQGIIPLHRSADLNIVGGSAFTDLQSGNLNYLVDDLALPQWQFDLKIGRSYNSQSVVPTILGNGWDLNLNLFLIEEKSVEDQSIPRYVTFKDQAGSLWRFVVETENEQIVGYTKPFGCPYSLEKISGLYQMTDESGIVYKFNSNLQLQAIIDQPYLMETSETLDTTTRLKEVALFDHAGNLDWKFTAVYDGIGALTGLTPASGCPFTLALVNNEYVLTEVQNSSMTYSFETNATDNHDQILAMTTTVQPTSIITPAMLTFSYNTSHQLTGVNDGDNHSISVVYGSGYIQITDLDGRKVIYNIASNQLNSVQRLESNENNNPVYATTLYTYDANGFLNSICDPDNVSDLLTFDNQGKLTSHANRHSQQTDAQNTVFTWWQYTFLDYATGTTTVRNQMRQYQRAASATEDTLLQTVRLSKSLYTIDTTEKLITSIALYPQPTLIPGEDGQDESDYNYGANPIKTITLTYSDEDTDGFYDLITQSTSDNDSATPNLSEESSVYTSATTFFPAYVSGEEETDTTIYDLAGRVSAICPDIENHGTTGHVCDQYTYSLAGRVLTEMTRKGLETSYTYDSSGRVCKTEHPDGHESTNGFDFISNPQSPFSEDYFLELETDYGLNYYLERHLNTLGQTVYEEIRNCGDWLNLSYTYNGLGQKASQTDKNGNVTSYTYYASGQVHEETVDQATGPEDLLTYYTYTEDDLIETETDPYNNVSSYVYDSENGNRLLSKSTIVNGKLTKEVYDYSTLETSHYYTLTTTSYDGSTDSAAVLTSTVTQLNEDDQTTSVSKSVSNLYNNQTAIQNTYVYDEDDQLWKIGHNGFYYVFGRDEDGTITSISVSDGTNTQILLEKTHTENTDGSTTDTDSYANGQDVSVITDKFGRTEKIQYNDGTTTVDRYVYAYGSEDTTENDVDGQEITTVDDNSSGRKTVSSKSDDADSFNQEIVVTDLNTLVQLYSCSIVNSETAVTLTTLVGATEQSYAYGKDTSGRLYQTDYELADSTTVQKTDSFGDYSELTGFVLNINSIARLQKSLSYRNISGVNFSGQVESETIQQSGTAVSYGYVYDGLGNITKITKTVGGTTTDLYRYKYDEASQLVREDNCVTSQTTTWQFDVGGNIRSRTVFALTAENSEPANPIDTIDYGYSTGIWKDLLTSYDGQSISYDASGNPTSYLGATMTWTMGRQLASYDKGSLSIDYTYNEHGIRTSKTVNNVRTDYYLNGSQVIAEVTGSNRIDYRYDGNGQLIALRYNGNEYYYVTNIQGDIIGLIDGSGTSVVQYTYDAWGSQTSCTGTLANTLGQANPYRYRGYRFDTETGLCYLQSRYYDAAVGRFINADKLSLVDKDFNIVNTSNYCFNSPVYRIDPYGTRPDDIKYTTYLKSKETILSAKKNLAFTTRIKSIFSVVTSHTVLIS